MTLRFPSGPSLAFMPTCQTFDSETAVETDSHHPFSNVNLDHLTAGLILLWQCSLELDDLTIYVFEIS